MLSLRETEKIKIEKELQKKERKRKKVISHYYSDDDWDSLDSEEFENFCFPSNNQDYIHSRKAMTIVRQTGALGPSYLPDPISNENYQQAQLKKKISEQELQDGTKLGITGACIVIQPSPVSLFQQRYVLEPAKKLQHKREALKEEEEITQQQFLLMFVSHLKTYKFLDDFFP